MGRKPGVGQVLNAVRLPNAVMGISIGRSVDRSADLFILFFTRMCHHTAQLLCWGPLGLYVLVEMEVLRSTMRPAYLPWYEYCAMLNSSISNAAALVVMTLGTNSSLGKIE